MKLVTIFFECKIYNLDYIEIDEIKDMKELLNNR